MIVKASRIPFLFSLLLLAACDAPDYPADWAKPTSAGWSASRKGDCPVLTGAYHARSLLY